MEVSDRGPGDLRRVISGMSRRHSDSRGNKRIEWKYQSNPALTEDDD